MHLDILAGRRDYFANQPSWIRRPRGRARTLMLDNVFAHTYIGTLSLNNELQPEYNVRDLAE